MFEKKYEISNEGNFEGKNILVETKKLLTENEDKKIKEINKKLLDNRNNRIKPFFDNKSQTDLNAYILETLLKISIILDDKKIKEETLDTIKIFNEKLSHKIFHCYESSEIDAFLEDHVYLGLLFITLYELVGDEKYLNKSINIMNETWKLFYNDKTGFFQKNKLKDNDLFADPIDLNDNNIPNGNSIYLYICNKLYTITNEKDWLEKSEILRKSFHQTINSFYSQMFSFIKTLDICENSLSFTFYGKINTIENIKKSLQSKFIGRSTFVYKNDNIEDGSVVICRNQTCSKKISDINEMEKYLLEAKLIYD